MQIYADNAATTKMSETAIEAMTDCVRNWYGNPSSLYTIGQKAKEKLEIAREEIAAVINANPREIIFTSGGSEADNQALLTAALNGKKQGKTHIISSAFEHHAILHTLNKLEKNGFEITLLPVHENGIIRLDELEQAIREDTCLVTIMTANNEIGTIQPIREIGGICRSRGVLFHTDAVQAFGHIPLNPEEAGVDLLSASAHKLHGPKGAGLLYVRRGLSLPPLLYGGSQENGRRAGTSNTAGIVGFGAAAEAAMKGMKTEAERIATMRDTFVGRVLTEIPGVRLNGHLTRRLPGIVSLTFSSLSGSELMMLMDRAGVCVSTGAACSAASREPSHVLTAIGLSRAEANGTIRLSLSGETTQEEMDTAAGVLKEAAAALRSL